MKKILFGLVLLVFILSACATATPEVVEVIKEVPAEPEISVFQKAQNGKPFRYAFTERRHPFMRMLTAGFLQACDDYGLLCELHGVDGIDEAQVMAYAEAMNPDDTSGAVFCMNNPSRFPSGQVIIDKGIPMVHHHTPREEGEIPGMLAWAGPSFEQYSTDAGKAVGEEVGCKGPVAVSQSGLSEGENKVIAGFTKGLTEVCPDITVLPVALIGTGDMPKSITVSTGVIQSNIDVTAAFSSTSDGAQAWAFAAEESGKEKGEIKVVGMDGTRVNLDLVKDGYVWMVVGQPVFEEAYYDVVLLVNHLMGYPVPFTNILPAPQITIDNVDDFYAIVDKAEAVPVD